jgi:hypothetical protein
MKFGRPISPRDRETCVLHERISPVPERHGVHDARRVRQIDQRLGLSGGHGERLVADNVFAFVIAAALTGK